MYLVRRNHFLHTLLAPALAQPAPAPRRRICVQFDAADHRDVPLPPAQWLDYLFAFADQPGSQIDSIFWDVSLGDTYAVYPSRLLPPSPDRHLVAWREQGFEWVPAIIAQLDVEPTPARPARQRRLP